MRLRSLPVPAVLSLLLLSSCSTPPPAPQVRELHQEVSQLNQQMRHLTRRAGALEQQGQLNSRSTQGAWLVPGSATPVDLETQLGTLRLALLNVSAEANGSQASLVIRSANDKPVPALSATVVWGESDPASGQPLAADSLSQRISVPASLMPRSTVTVPLHLSGLTPDRLGYVRVHEVTADAAP